MNAKRTFMISSFIFLFAFLFYYGLPENKTNADFRWISPNPALKSVITTTGNSVSIPFEFKVEKNISEVTLEIEDKTMEHMGVYLEKAAVEVKDGVAASVATFRLTKAISDGHHRLKIIAKDNATGNVIGEGEIPFNVNILDVLWKCSC